MKKVKTVLATSAAAAAIALGSTPAMADLEASATVSNIYLWRGVDQGSGGAAVSGDIVYSAAGFYGGVWASSAGGVGSGGEINLFAGWSGEFGGLGIDIGALNYYFPGGSDTFGETSDAYLGLSFAGFELYHYNQIAGPASTFPGQETLNDNTYTSLGYSMGKFSALVGMFDGEEAKPNTFTNSEEEDDYTHLDLSYAFNDNLSFTVSKIISVEDGQNKNISFSTKPGPKKYDDDTLFVVSYSIPLM